MKSNSTPKPRKFYIVHDGVKHTMGQRCPICEEILTESHRESSRKGGQSKFDRYGRESFAEMGKKGSKAVRDKYGPEYYKKLSAAGVKARLAKKNKHIEKIESEVKNNG